MRLDKKGRLVLPLEIRDALGIKNGEKILLSVSSAKDSAVTIRVAKALPDSECCPYSRNGSYARKMCKT
ncbi:MAG: AbrB/MazE/SpoVT family DNA-binding domain-containing protein [Candidatus Micrarchaeia archaeon]